MPELRHDSCDERLNQLENRVSKVELEHADRQIQVLKAMEKVLYQLRSREAKRAKSEPSDEILDDPGGEDPAVARLDPRVTRVPRQPPSTAHLAKRLRGF